MKASVKIMLSYDYNHFEIQLATDEDLRESGVNELRKTAQRLADEAVRQYKVAKAKAEKRSRAPTDRRWFLEEIGRIQAKPEGERTVNEMAQLKLYEDNEWQKQFEHDYDYEDDWEDEE